MEVEETAEVDELAIAFSVQHLDIENVDEGDESNPQLVSQYVNDIYRHLRHLEVGTVVFDIQGIRTLIMERILNVPFW